MPRILCIGTSISFSPALISFKCQVYGAILLLLFYCGEFSSCNKALRNVMKCMCSFCLPQRHYVNMMHFSWQNSIIWIGTLLNIFSHIVLSLSYSSLHILVIRNILHFWIDFTDCLDNKHTIAPDCVQISYSAVKALLGNNPFTIGNSIAPGMWVNTASKNAKGWYRLVANVSLQMWVSVIYISVKYTE